MGWEGGRVHGMTSFVYGDMVKILLSVGKIDRLID